MIKTRTIVVVLGMSVCFVLLLLWWGSAKNVHASSIPTVSTGRLIQGSSGVPAPAQSPSPSSPHGQSQHRPVSEAAREERPRAQKPRRVLSGVGGSGRRRFKGRGSRKSRRPRSGSVRAGGNAVREARVRHVLKRQLEMPSQTPRKKRIAKKWANELSHGTSMNRLLTRKLEAAPIMQHVIERMGVVSHIDRLVQAHAARRISHGEAVAALMVYLLNGGRALYRMEQWAEQTAVLSWLFPQYRAEEWTDDRLADTLDALYKAGLESVQGELSAHIVDAFGLTLSEIHDDTTSVSLWGTYDAESGQPAVLITFGYSKDHRPDLKHVVVGSAVSGDGGIPLLSNTHDGNTSDSTVPIPYWERLRQLAGTSAFCFVGDGKLASQKTLNAICTADGMFLSPLAMSTTEQASIRTQLQSGTLVFTPIKMPENERLKPVYKKRTERVGNRRKRPQHSPEDAGGDTEKPEEGKGRKQDATYDVFEDTTELRDNRNRPHTIRRLIVRSSQ